uniref:Uncharacterized protein n=1 Tax=Sipha flava TaxID=143950 RepID=A0A2S2Q263_9HEMI
MYECMCMCVFLCVCVRVHVRSMLKWHLSFREQQQRFHFNLSSHVCAFYCCFIVLPFSLLHTRCYVRYSITLTHSMAVDFVCVLAVDSCPRLRLRSLVNSPQ